MDLRVNYLNLKLFTFFKCRIYVECGSMSLPIVGGVPEMNLFLGCVLLDILDNFL